MKKTIYRLFFAMIFILVIAAAYISGSYSAKQKMKFFYYKNLFTTAITSDQLVAKMRDKGGVAEEIDIAFVKSLLKEVYNGNEEVIGQLVQNISHEVTKEKILLQGDEYEVCYTINGLSYYLLYDGATWGATTPFMMKMAVLASETQDVSLFEKMCELDLVYIYEDDFQQLGAEPQKDILMAFLKLSSYSQSMKSDSWYRNLILSTSSEFYLTEYANIDKMLKLAKAGNFDDAYNMYVSITTSKNDSETVFMTNYNYPNLKRLFKESKLDRILK
ncbi:MAG: hypothetical protein ACIAQZ_14880 [Sedimentisphaeraceae bacterium JB056]